MKRIFSLLLIVIFLSCTKDDFCLEPVTPDLIIRFYDVLNTTDLKAVDQMNVWTEAMDSVLVNVSLDSISIPLNVNSNQTIYNVSKGDFVDQLTINYEIEEVFVSRSCGFKAVFNNVEINTNSNNWIQQIDPTSIETIKNESSAHVQIFH